MSGVPYKCNLFNFKVFVIFFICNLSILFVLSNFLRWTQCKFLACQIKALLVTCYISCHLCPLGPLILQPLVENCVTENISGVNVTLHYYWDTEWAQSQHVYVARNVLVYLGQCIP
jgi:hypothetical protein